MADYISTLTGQQMDASLLDMAQHNSEAYAVGTRDGVPVSSGDETYQNNSKYYSQIAADLVEGTGITDPNNDGNLVVSLPSGDSDSWAVRTDVAQDLTDAQKAQARANIGATSTNANILMNPWFTVNQRGSASYTANGYTVDRWANTNSTALTSVAVGSTGITLTKASGGYAFFRQYINAPIDLNATYTLSILDSNGNVYSATRQFVNGTSSETLVSVNGMTIGFGLYGKDATPYVALYFGTGSSGSVTLRAIKLELGSICTLANDAPPDYAEELAKCQLYFERIKASTANLSLAMGNAGSTTIIYCPLKIAPKRATPTVTVDTGLGIGTSSLNLTSTAVAIQGASISTGNFTLQVTTSGLTQGNVYRVGVLSGHYIDFSADL